MSLNKIVDKDGRISPHHCSLSCECLQESKNIEILNKEINDKNMLIKFQSQQIGQLLKENKVFSKRDYDFKIEKENEELKNEIKALKNDNVKLGDRLINKISELEKQKFELRFKLEKECKLTVYNEDCECYNCSKYNKISNE